MSLEVSRVFHPVGQGAFYSESHYEENGRIFNIVYDCGSLTIRKIKLERKVKGAFREGSTIDILFLSHFDDDHINGVEYLKKHFQIKLVVVPLVDEEEKVLIKFKRFLDSGNTDNSLLDNPTNYFGPETQVISIEPLDFGGNIFELNSGQNDNFIDLDKNLRINHYPSGTRISGSIIANWCFIPFNYKQEERSRLFKELLIYNNLEFENLENVEYLNERKSELRSVYKKVDGSININSLVCYSGPLNKINDRFIVDCLITRPFDRYYLGGLGGCLYMGDVDLNVSNIIDDLFQRLGNLWGNVTTVQIPHHGANRSFNSKLLNENLSHLVISYGTNNPWGHPADFVIENCLRKCNLSLVSEYSESMTVEQIYIK